MVEPRERPHRVDPARVLLWVYGLFVVAAGARSVVQLATHATRAPVAYTLSAVAAVVYVTGFVLLRNAARGGTARPAVVCAWCELLGVLLVGTASLTVRDGFPDATVWSYYGAGYLFAPLALPVFALVYLRRHKASVV